MERRIKLLGPPKKKRGKEKTKEEEIEQQNRFRSVQSQKKVSKTYGPLKLDDTYNGYNQSMFLSINRRKVE